MVENKQTQNLVDAFVKKSMLSYFTIFPTREHVLNHLLLTIGNGYEWTTDENGYHIPTAIMESRNLKEIPPHMPSELDNYHQIDEAHRVNDEFQSMIIEWANKNIDVISGRWFHFYGHSIERTRLYEHCGTYSLLANLPDNPHPDWKVACESFAEDCLVRVRMAGAGGINSEQLADFVKKHLPNMHQITTVCLAAVEKLRDPAKDALIEEMIRNLEIQK